jgi:hypothetical protein
MELLQQVSCHRKVEEFIELKSKQFFAGFSKKVEFRKVFGNQRN